MYPASDMPLGNMGHLVCQHARQFVFIPGRFKQPGVDTNKAARQGKCVDYRTVDYEKVSAG